jgi:pimeloyl-ACP methyl ester carboxylesterase
LRIDVGDGVRLYVDIDGMGLVPVGGRMVQRPALVLLHGGPGFDHAGYKLRMHEMRDVAQVVMYDHRGNGRSDRRSPAEWNLDTWADDVVRLCDALGIEQPVVLGNSFGGFVAQRYLGRHPEHPSKVILSSTAARWDLDAVLAMFGALGGDEAVDVARTFWTDPTREHGAAYRRICGPLYTQTTGNMFDAVEMVRNPDVFPHWQHGENQTFDLRSDLACARCPVLVLGGEHDPVCPITGSEEIVSCLPPEFVQFERFEHSGHGVFRDEPERAMRVLREFACSETPN